MIKKGLLLIVILILTLSIMGCSKNNDNDMKPSDITLNDSEAAEIAPVNTIDAEEAMEIMASGDVYTLIDVRTQEEFDEGHIEGALLLPNDQIGTLATEQLPDKEAVILVYCRSGNRSAQASQVLVELGYTNIYDFGGIISWPGEIVK